MKTFYLGLFCLLIIPCLLFAESFTAEVDEVDASAASNLQVTCFYYCLCKNASACACTDWTPARSTTGAYCVPATNGGDGGTDNIQHTWNIKLYSGDLPATMRYTATSVTTTGNESTRGITVNTYTFTQ